MRMKKLLKCTNMEIKLIRVGMVLPKHIRKGQHRERIDHHGGGAPEKGTKKHQHGERINKKRGMVLRSHEVRVLSENAELLATNVELGKCCVLMANTRRAKRVTSQSGRRFAKIGHTFF